MRAVECCTRLRTGGCAGCAGTRGTRGGRGPGKQAGCSAVASPLASTGPARPSASVWTSQQTTAATSSSESVPAARLVRRSMPGIDCYTTGFDPGLLSGCLTARCPGLPGPQPAALHGRLGQVLHRKRDTDLQRSGAAAGRTALHQLRSAVDLHGGKQLGSLQ